MITRRGFLAFTAVSKWFLGRNIQNDLPVYPKIREEQWIFEYETWWWIKKEVTPDGTWYHSRVYETRFAPTGEVYIRVPGEQGAFFRTETDDYFYPWCKLGQAPYEQETSINGNPCSMPYGSLEIGWFQR